MPTPPPLHLRAIGDGVGIITLDRPERMNALSGVMMDELLPALCAEADRREDIRVVVLTGAGGNFCAGADVEERLTAVSRRLSETAEGQQPDLGQFVLPLLQIAKPTIAAVDGMAAGGGLALAMACDMRTASERARFCAPFVRRALVPDSGLTDVLVRAIGLGGAFDLCLTGRVVDSLEALGLGLIQRRFEDASWWESTLELAAAIAAGPQTATRLTKRALARGRREAVEDALLRESWFQSTCMRDPDFKEGVDSFLEKRPPRFRSA